MAGSAPVDAAAQAAAVADLFRDAEVGLLQTVAHRLGPGPDDGPTWAREKLADLAIVRQRLATQTRDLDQLVRLSVPAQLDAAYRGGGALALVDLADHGLGMNRLPPARARAIDLLARDTTARLTGIIPTILRKTLDVYQSVVAVAVATVAAGGLTRRDATQLALNRFARQGITGFQDKGGRNWSLDSYAEMAARTGAGQAAIQGHVDHLAANGVDLVQVNDTPRECPKCRPYEGQILSISGQTGTVSVASAVGPGMVDVEVFATLEDARGNGLQHPNCRHRTTAYLPGATPRVRATADPAGYEASQRQRKIERDIRAAKREQAVAITPKAQADAARKVRAHQAQMRDHLAANPDLMRRNAREQPRDGNSAPPSITQARDVVPDPVKPRTDNDLTDDELSEQMTAALDAGDFDRYEVLGNVSDAREAAARAQAAIDAAAAVKRAQEAARSQARRDAAQEAKATRLEQLLDAGVDPREAAAQAYGLTIEKVLRQELTASLRTDGFTGTLEQMVTQAFAHELDLRYLEAEQYARGAELVNREGQARGIDPRALFEGSDKTARRYASQELANYWNSAGRLTRAEFREELLSDPAAAARRRAERKDYGQ